ncbi:hypothetical protein FOA52_006775 [Chlamydomonas sp. UWO 241]|nr:hypothetical protein FOA52_006775 [Chlamydomonas sp. UWO 241]
MSAHDVVGELEKLRSLVDASSPRFKGVRPESLRQSVLDMRRSSYGGMLDSTSGSSASLTPRYPSASVSNTDAATLAQAQGSVSRLGRAIDAAEEEMDATLRRASSVQKTQLRQAEVDLAEMHHLVHSKERSLQALRDTLTQEQRSHEQQLSKAEAALALKDAELTASQEDLRVTRADLMAVKTTLREEVAAAMRQVEDVTERERGATRDAVRAMELARADVADATRVAATVRADAAAAVRALELSRTECSQACERERHAAQSNESLRERERQGAERERQSAAAIEALRVKERQNMSVIESLRERERQSESVIESLRERERQSTTVIESLRDTEREAALIIEGMRAREQETAAAMRESITTIESLDERERQSAERERQSMSAIEALRVRERQIASVVESLRERERRSTSVVDSLQERERQSASVVESLREREHQSESVIESLRERERQGAERERQSMAVIESLHDTEREAALCIEGMRERERQAAAAMRESAAAVESLRVRERELSVALDASRERERDARAGAESRANDCARLASSLAAERDARRVAAAEAVALHARASALADDARDARVDAAAARERTGHEMDELTRQLHVERAMRRACEKWLRAELKSRDDYDLLLRTIRDTACASAQGLSPAALQAARSSLRSGGGGGGSGVRSAASTGGGAYPQGRARMEVMGLLGRGANSGGAALHHGLEDASHEKRRGGAGEVADWGVQMIAELRDMYATKQKRVVAQGAHATANVRVLNDAPARDAKVVETAKAHPSSPVSPLPSTPYSTVYSPARAQPADPASCAPRVHTPAASHPPRAGPAAVPAGARRGAMSGEASNQLRFSMADFEFGKLLGAGTFGRVYLACHKQTRQLYAVKVLSKAAQIHSGQVKHVQEERRILAKVKHPFIVRLHGTFQDPACVYMAMDFVPGGELFSIMKREKKMPEEHARFYAACVVLSLQYMHSHNILWRDLKPENLLVGGDGYVRATDLGFAKIVTTKTYTFCGTPDYMAPEIILNHGHTHAVDWWSLGCIIYEMLHGYPPFYTGDMVSTYHRIMRPDALAFPDRFSSLVTDLLKNLLQIDPTQRLGVRGNGVKDVMDHPWFGNLDWDLVHDRVYRPPHVPQQAGTAGDVGSNYDPHLASVPPMVHPFELSTDQQSYFIEF